MISIVLPFRDAAQTLKECLHSIAEQGFTDYECLAIDDGSSDDSARLVKQACANDKRIRYLNNHGKGLVAALNLGLANARHPLIARMDADDRMRPTRLQRQHDFLSQHPRIGLVACQTRKFPEAIVQQGYRRYIDWQNRLTSPEDIADEIYVESPLPHPSVMFRADLIRALGGYRQGMFPEDYELWLRLHHAGVGMGKVDEVLLDWRESAGRLSRVDPRYQRSAFDQLRADYLAQDPRLTKLTRPLVVWGAGRAARRRAELLIQRRPQLRIAAWVDVDPNKIGNRIGGIPVIAAEQLLSDSERPLVLVYVTNHGARPLIEGWLRSHGWQRGCDYWFVG